MDLFKCQAVSDKIRNLFNSQRIKKDKVCRSWPSVGLKISKFWLFDNSFSLFCFAQIVISMLSTVLTSRAFTFYAIIATKTNCFSGWKFSIRKVCSFHKSMHFTSAVCLKEIEVSAIPSPMIIPTVSKTHWLFYKVFKSLRPKLGSEAIWFSVSTVTVNLWILKYLKTVLSSLYKNTRSHCCILFNLCLAFIHNLTLKNFKLIVLLQMPTLIP